MATLWAPNTDGERLVPCRVGAAQEGCDASPGSSVTGERPREGVLWSILSVNEVAPPYWAIQLYPS